MARFASTLIIDPIQARSTQTDTTYLSRRRERVYPLSGSVGRDCRGARVCYCQRSGRREISSIPECGNRPLLLAPLACGSRRGLRAYPVVAESIVAVIRCSPYDLANPGNRRAKMTDLRGPLSPIDPPGKASRDAGSHWAQSREVLNSDPPNPGSINRLH